MKLDICIKPAGLWQSYGMKRQENYNLVGLARNLMAVRIFYGAIVA
jgi:hypothetical protein